MLLITETTTKTVSLGAFLRSKREHAGFSQTKLSEKIGCSKNNVSNIECDKREPRLSYLIKMAVAIQEKPSVMLADFIDRVV